MKKLIGNYAYEILISLGYVCLVLVCWGYAKLGVTDRTAFWASVYPSAFVDIISIVVSAIIITALVNRKREHDIKKELYTIIKYAHNNLFAELYARYLFIISVREGDTHGELYDKDELKDHHKVGNYLRKHVSKYYNHETIIIKRSVKEKSKDVVFEKGVTENVARSYLFEEYVKFVNNRIDNFLKEYHFLLNGEYLSILVEIKEELKYNPFLIFKFDEEDEYGFPTYITDVDAYVLNNQNYIHKVYKLHEYFLEVK